jgi:protocatechuate 3,4-dioxygenase beta subunit
MANQYEQRRPLRELSEGPYYKEGSPERTGIAQSGTTGEKLIVEGRVLNEKGEPISGAWLDFWQADGKGEYDNAGYNLRGHQYTDEKGTYHLETVIPSIYSSRTAHIHVKLQADPRSRVLTTQLFFPGVSRNRSDRIFDPIMVVELNDTPEGKRARYDFMMA